MVNQDYTHIFILKDPDRITWMNPIPVLNKDYLTDAGILKCFGHGSVHLPDEKVKFELMLLLSYWDSSGIMCDKSNVSNSSHILWHMTTVTNMLRESIGAIWGKKTF